jgi:predicted transcriptional regulator
MGESKLETNNTYQSNSSTEGTKTVKRIKGMKQDKEQILVGTRIPKSDLTLPKEVADILTGLPLAERKAYASELRKAGWTLQSIATPLNITRESIRLYGLAEHSNEVLAKISHLPIVEPLKVQVFVERVKRVKPDPQVIAQLKELQPKAMGIRGKTKKNRDEAELYTKLIYELMESGVSGYRIAKELGVTHSALAFRLVRYGYTTSEGKSRSYRPLTHRSKGEETNAKLVQ